MNFRTGCEVADSLAVRLGVGEPVRTCLACTFERWNGQGFPNRIKGEAIPVPMRLVHLCQELEVLERVLGRDEGLAEVRRRAGRAYDPDLVALLGSVGEELDRLGDLTRGMPGLQPLPSPIRRARVPACYGDALDEALATVADFADLKSPFTAGHSRGVANLAAAGAAQAGLSTCRRRKLPQGRAGARPRRAGIPNSVWGQTRSAHRAERDRADPYAGHRATAAPYEPRAILHGPRRQPP